MPYPRGAILADKEAYPKRAIYSLTGHSIDGDKRTTPIRGDLADIKLAGKLFAPHYAVPMLRTGIAPVTEIHAEPHASSMPVSALMHGEEFAVLDIAGEWAWGYCLHDDYLGYLRIAELGDDFTATHIVSAHATLLVAQPSIKAPVLARAPTMLATTPCKCRMVPPHWCSPTLALPRKKSRSVLPTWWTWC